MTTHLVTFSDDSMSRARDLCVSSALAFGVDRVWPWSKEAIEHWGVVDKHPHVFVQPTDTRRAWAWWAWKPFIVKKAMTLRNDGDTLIYSDAGVEFINNVNYIIDRMDQDIFLFGNMWEHAHWSKRDVVDAVWPDYRMQTVRTEDDYRRRLDQMWERFGKQVQASVIFFRVSDYSRKFVKEWLDWCLFEGGRLIDDSPSRLGNHPEFQEHRHDQAILTTMAYREGIKLHWWPASYNDGGFTYERGDYPDEGYPVLFNHHRRRNHEWEQVA